MTSRKANKITRPLFVITARGGSKGIPGKNIKPLAGKPLIQYSVDLAKALCPDHQRIIVSTDSPEIAAAASIDVPFMRPAELATDTTPSRDVILHAMDWADSQGIEYNCVVLLQPTSPLRNADDVRRCIERYTPAVDMVVTVAPSAANPYYNLFEVNRRGYLHICKGRGLYTRRQDAPPVCEINGAVYAINPKSLREKTMGQFTRRVPVMMPAERSIDLDTLADWERAEKLILDQQ